jgi:hypothetical protein
MNKKFNNQTNKSMNIKTMTKSLISIFQLVNVLLNLRAFTKIYKIFKQKMNKILGRQKYYQEADKKENLWL